MATENGIHVPTRSEFMTGRTIVRVEQRVDATDGEEWTELHLDNGAAVHIREYCGWVLVDALVNRLCVN